MGPRRPRTARGRAPDTWLLRRARRGRSPQEETAVSPWARMDLGCQQLAQDERQDATVQVVVDLDRRIDAQQHRYLLLRSVLAVDDERDVHLRTNARLDPG